MKRETHTSPSARRHTARVHKQLGRVGLTGPSIEKFFKKVVQVAPHTKTVLSLSLCTLGVLHAASLCTHVIGRALAWSRDMNPKHCIKQVDRLLSNNNFVVGQLFVPWVRFAVGPRPAILVALDWTDLDEDDHSVIGLYLSARRRRATQLLWMTVEKSKLARMRNRYEGKVIEMLDELLAKKVKVTLLADRGFGDQKRHEQLRQLGWDYPLCHSLSLEHPGH